MSGCHVVGLDCIEHCAVWKWHTGRGGRGVALKYLMGQPWSLAYNIEGAARYPAGRQQPLR
jgi:hypothetical protein